MSLVMTRPAAERQPRIVAVGFHRLKDLLHELAPEYAGAARVEVLDRGFEEAVAEIQALRRRQRIDVLVAAGSNGAFLRQRLDLPVVLVKVGGFDVMRALGRARRIGARIALVTYGAVPAEVRQFNDLFQLGLELRSYATEPEARDCVRELRAQGVEVVVAPGLVADLAQAAGMEGVFLYSQDAVREALDDAVEVARVARIEAARHERLNAVLGELRDGVAAVDLQERIQTLNPAMERLLGRPASELVGLKLGEVAPALSLAGTLRSGQAELEAIEQYGAFTLVTSRIPIVEQGAQAGAVLICQDPASIQRVERHLRAQRQRPASAARYRLDEIVGDSEPIRRAKALAAQFARSDATVLVVGESGTGKELLAQGLHRASRRARQPFVAVNCAAFSESLLESELFGYEEGAFTGARKGGKPGLFEAAHTGTIFLDEIGEMPLPLQTRLLRVLQEREVLRIGAVEPTPVDVRVIAATHRDLPQRVAAGEFRRDLYYRLNILRVELPSLRERREDLPALAAHLLRKIAARLRIPLEPAQRLVEALLQAAVGYDWPGNVRELENLIERLASVAQDDGAAGRLHELVPEVLGGAAAAPARQGQETELQRIERVLHECGGDRQAACRRLGIGRTTLWRKLAKGRAAA
ncbi:MAG: propionate catabolism operon regulatory protein PrpR [Pseudomonadota bacterium]